MYGKGRSLYTSTWGNIIGRVLFCQKTDSDILNKKDLLLGSKVRENYRWLLNTHTCKACSFCLTNVLSLVHVCSLQFVPCLQWDWTSYTSLQFFSLFLPRRCHFLHSLFPPYIEFLSPKVPGPCPLSSSTHCVQSSLSNID